MKTKAKSAGLILTLAFLSLLAAINAVLFNVAFPNISRDLHLVSSQVSWIAIGYSMVVAIGSIIYGKLADAISQRKLFLIGIGLFILGSLLGFSKHDSLGIIILARMLQASGGSAFITLAMVAVRLMIEPQRRPLAFSFISVGIALAIGLGPLIAGGLLVVLAWWFNKTPAPFIEIKLLKNLVFVRAITVGLIINVVLLGGLFLLPLLLANSYQLSSLKVGLIFFGASIFSSLASLFVGGLLPNYGSLTLIYVGATLMALSLLLLYFFTGVAIIGLATGLLFISYSTIQVALNSLVPLTLGNKVGLGLGVYNLANFIGMALGPAISSKILDATHSYGLAFLSSLILVGLIFPLLFRLTIPKNQ